MTEANVEGSLIVDEIRETVNSNLANFQRDLDDREYDRLTYRPR